MTRDSHNVQRDFDLTPDDLSALWVAAKFPRLPTDAPESFQSRTIDVKNHTVLLKVHHAYRRHDFQNLVQRYTNQLVYGCQAKHCDVPTCFTCRKRLAGKAGIRRYTPTSVRGLACYLASQSNPESGLCRHPSLAPSTQDYKATSKQSSSIAQKDSFRRANGNATSSQDVSGRENISRKSSSRSIDTSDSSPARQNGMADSSKSLGRKGESIYETGDSRTSPLRQSPKKDHKSFVQNVCSTVAFRMLEWLTPQTLDEMSRPSQDRSLSAKDEELSDPCHSHPVVIEDTLQHNPPQTPSTQNGLPVDMGDSRKPPPPEPRATTNKIVTKKDPERSFKSSAAMHKAAANSHKPFKSIDGNIDKLAEQKSQSRDAGMMGPQSPHKVADERWGDLSDTHGLQNKKQLSAPDQTMPNAEPLTKQCSTETGIIDQRRLSFPTSGICSDVNRALDTHDSSSSASPDGHENQEQDPSDSNVAQTVHNEAPSQQIDHENRKSVIKGTEYWPQSLSQLDPESIEHICNMLQEYGGVEAHVLVPHLVPRRNRKIESQLSNVLPWYRLNGQTKLSREWRDFSEQSFFYVLSQVDVLLKSFSDEHNQLLDSLSLWYCMFRLTRAAPTIVFDSLWVSAAKLYGPPPEVQSRFSWTTRISQHSVSGSGLSLEKTAELMSVCLHTLAASLPDLKDPALVYNISRLRAQGIICPGGGPRALVAVEPCLQYNDILSDSLALRLARRVFASIPTIRVYQELMRFDDQNITTPDILDLVLDSLGESRSTSKIEFSQDERDVHNGRLPQALLDWARTVMLQDWDGKAEVPSTGNFAGALALLAGLYSKREALHLNEHVFRSDYYGGRLDLLEMPVEWTSFLPNDKSVHLLEHPYLFPDSKLVDYFRAINFARMRKAFEDASYFMNRATAMMSPMRLMTDPERRQQLFDRLRVPLSKFLVLEVRRDKILMDTFNSLWRRERRELVRPLKVRLGEGAGEEGFDLGGVQQEFFRLAVAEALDPLYGAFTSDSQTRMTWFSPGSPEPAWKFELIGLIFSLAIYNGVTLPVTLPVAFYRKLLDLPVTEIEHIEDGWPDLAKGLNSLLMWDEKHGKVSDVFSRTYEFSIDSFGEQVSRDMQNSDDWPQFGALRDDNPTDANMVTIENRERYVHDYIKWLTDISIQPQFKAFRDGFITCLSEKSLSLFKCDPTIFKAMTEGVQDIDVSELQSVTRYVGWLDDESNPTIKSFWSIVKSYDADMKKKLLEFVTASDRVPVGGMKNVTFVIQKNGDGSVGGESADGDPKKERRLPTSYTCYGTLLLPEYGSKELLKEKLGMALENAQGFGFA